MQSKHKNTKNKSSTFSMSFDDFTKYLDQKELSKTATEELTEFNINTEYKKLKTYKEKGNELGLYDKAIYNLCESIIECVRHDPKNGDYYSEENKKRIVEAGELLNKYDGSSVMHDVLMSWVPKRYRNEISISWDNIGTWRG